MPTATIHKSELKTLLRSEPSRPAFFAAIPDHTVESLSNVLLGPFATWISCMYSSNWGERPMLLGIDLLRRD